MVAARLAVAIQEAAATTGEAMTAAVHTAVELLAVAAVEV